MMLESELNSLPSGDKYNPPERVVCAANRYGNTILLGLRHGDALMNRVYDSFESVHCYLSDEDEEQGFITSYGRFVSRTEAWTIAVFRNQIVRRVGGDSKDGGTLYSENLY